MINIAKEKNQMPQQCPSERAHNFKEVSTGYSEQEAIREAMRCLKCRKKPCTEGCPIQQRIPDFIAKVAEGEFEAAYEIITERSSLPAVCGRVCPHEEQCEGHCTRGKRGQSVVIGGLERFVADYHAAHSKKEATKYEPNGKKVAVIGAGPAGLACAGDLVQKGFDVTVFEKEAAAGGVLYYGIPQYRLPKEIIDAEVAKLGALGVTFNYDTEVGKAVSVDSLIHEKGFGAVFIGNGADVPKWMGIPGEDLQGVYTSDVYLKGINKIDSLTGDVSVSGLPKAKHAIIVGGGNVAMDACRSAKRMGAETVTVVYRRSRAEMPACDAEIAEAMAEGIEFKYLTNPVELKGENGKLTTATCQSMELGAPDESGRRRPVVIKGSEHDIPCDLCIMAISSGADKEVAASVAGLEVDKWGSIKTNEDTSTNVKGVFAGGDAVTGPLTVVKAMKAGKDAAKAIAEYLK